MDVSEAIRLRRSVHSYDAARRVDPELVREIVELATLAPSSFNLNHWRFVLVTSEEGRRALHEASLNQRHILEAPAVLILLGKMNAHEDVGRFTEDWVGKGYYPDDRHLRLVSENFYGKNALMQRDEAIRSPSIMAGMLMLAATERGLSTAPIIGFHAGKVLERFSIPENYVPVMLLTLGYEKQPMPQRVRRLGYDEIVMEERFDPAKG